MKLLLVLLFRVNLLNTIAVGAGAMLPSLATDTNLRGSARQNHTQTLENTECTLFLKSTRYLFSSASDPQEKKFIFQEKWSCEFEKEDNFSLDGSIHTTFEIEGVTDAFLESRGAKSGHSLLAVSEAIVGESDGRLVIEIPPTSRVKVLERPNDFNSVAQNRRNRKLVAASGTLKMLVVRVISMSGIEPTASIDQLRSDVFEDQLCLQTQIKACSHGRLKIEPFRGTTSTGRKINGGVVDVKVDINPSIGNMNQMEAKAKERTTESYGELVSQFDLVMFCIPPGSGDWLAYAYINRFDSFFNDKWSSSVSTQVHEIGHSLGLAHSGEGSNAYGDQSGMMGYSYDMDDTPKMCFNPAKNYQLGWYKEQQQFLNPLTDILAKSKDKSNSREYILNGVSDFRFGRNGFQDKFISLRLKQQNSQEDYYVGFNRKSGINSGTVEDANNVIIVKKKGGPTEYGQSWKVSKLSKIGQKFTMKRFDGSSFDVTVELLSIVGRDARVEISVIDSVPCNKVKDSNKLKFKNSGKKNCQWVSKWRDRRCSKVWKRKLLSEWCPRTCGCCPDTAFAAESLLHDDKENDAKTMTIRRACVDIGNLSFRNDFTKNCAWVGKGKRSDNRCGKEWLGLTLSNFCPRTCGSCL